MSSVPAPLSDEEAIAQRENVAPAEVSVVDNAVMIPVAVKSSAAVSTAAPVSTASKIPTLTSSVSDNVAAAPVSARQPLGRLFAQAAGRG